MEASSWHQNEVRYRGVFSTLFFIHDGVCQVIGYIKAFTLKSFSSQLFHIDEKF